jgi:hypothetical protein
MICAENIWLSLVSKQQRYIISKHLHCNSCKVKRG